MLDTNTRKLPKIHTGFSHRRTIVDAFRKMFERFQDSGVIVLSYGSNAIPDMDTLLNLLRAAGRQVDVRTIPHTYHYGTHRAAARRLVHEYIFVAR
jgi:DNA adenine methylase/adenine-specific DNA-methyltransferase